MSEPLRSPELGEGPLAEAALRLERSLDRLEAALARGRGDAPVVLDDPTPELQAANDALVGELAVTRRRGRKLKAAAAEASEAVGRAMVEVRRALDEDAAAQGQLDFVLESEPGSGDEPSTDGPPDPAGEEPTG